VPVNILAGSGRALELLADNLPDAAAVVGVGIDDCFHFLQFLLRPPALACVLREGQAVGGWGREGQAVGGWRLGIGVSGRV
jgi:hypothetical protein